MLSFTVEHQKLTLNQDLVVSDTIGYLTANFVFSEDWNEYTKWAHFTKGRTTYDIQLDENNNITSDQNLNLSAGTWLVYLHGNKGTGENITRITTSIIQLNVDKTGILNGEPFPSMPASVSEKAIQNSEEALSIAESVRQDADEGLFDGLDGVGIQDIIFKEETEEGNVYTIYLTDGNEYDIVCPRGPQGEPGPVNSNNISVGKEFWTGDYFSGKSIYRKCISLLYLPKTAEDNFYDVSVDLGHNKSTILGIVYSYAKSSGGTVFSLPYNANSRSNDISFYKPSNSRYAKFYVNTKNWNQFNLDTYVYVVFDYIKGE